MKRLKLYAFAVCAAGALCFHSCTLEEYNPSGSTPALFDQEAGFEALVNSAYAVWGGQFYGREDFVLLLDGGNDLWINIGNGGYGRQMTKYEELSSTVGQIKNTWNRLYEIINYCNAGLGRIDRVVYKDEKLKETRRGELSFLRAYAYWHLVELFGNVEKRVEETQSDNIVLSARRSSYEDLYDLMLSDVKTAVANLPATPQPAKETGRATLKAAYGLLARIALTRVAYCKDDAEKDTYYRMAEDAATYVTEHGQALHVSLYDRPGEVFDPANNKTNKEALFVVTHSTEPSLNMQSANPNRLHMYFHAGYTNRAGMVQDYTYGNDKNGKVGSMAMMPTRYLLELYNARIDARYRAWFREAYLLNTPSAWAWTKDQLTYFEKPESMAGTEIQPGDTALLFTKERVADKRNKPYAVVDIDDIYDKDGGVSKNANFNIHFPTLLKYEDASIAERGLPTNSQVGSNDVITMRLAEMYLIAAECEVMRSGGSKEKAAEYVNVIRRRAAVPGHEADMAVDAKDMTLEFILEERARELCGEFMRWFDLKRTGKLVEYVREHNPDIPLIQPYHKVRPIPRMFLDSILNPDEFGQNEGYV